MFEIFVGIFPIKWRIANNKATTIMAQIVVALLPSVLKMTIESTVIMTDNKITKIIPFLLVIRAAKSSFPCEISSVLCDGVVAVDFLPFSGVVILINTIRITFNFLMN